MLGGVEFVVFGVDQLFECVLDFDVVFSGEILAHEKFETGSDGGDEVGLGVFIQVKNIVVELLSDAELRTERERAVTENEDGGGFEGVRFGGGGEHGGASQAKT